MDWCSVETQRTLGDWYSVKNTENIGWTGAVLKHREHWGDWYSVKNTENIGWTGAVLKHREHWGTGTVLKTQRTLGGLVQC